MTNATRFNLWLVVVVAVASVQHIGFAIDGVPPAVNIAFVATVAALLAAIVALIVTTPPDAIVLPTWKSVVVLTTATAVLYAHDLWRAGRQADVGVAAVTAVVAAGCFAAVAWRRGFTPWWVAPLYWNPLMVGPLSWPPVATAVAAVAAFVLSGTIRRAFGRRD